MNKENCALKLVDEIILTICVVGFQVCSVIVIQMTAVVWVRTVYCFRFVLTFRSNADVEVKWKK